MKHNLCYAVILLFVYISAACDTDKCPDQKVVLKDTAIFIDGDLKPDFLLAFDGVPYISKCDELNTDTIHKLQNGSRFPPYETYRMQKGSDLVLMIPSDRLTPDALISIRNSGECPADTTAPADYSIVNEQLSFEPTISLIEDYDHEQRTSLTSCDTEYHGLATTLHL